MNTPNPLPESSNPLGFLISMALMAVPTAIERGDLIGRKAAESHCIAGARGGN